jgi:hypothetical protein
MGGEAGRESEEEMNGDHIGVNEFYDVSKLVVNS